MGWYNGGNRKIEEIGIVYHEGFDLGFETDGKPAPNERETIPISAPSISHTDYLLENQHPSQTITR